MLLINYANHYKNVYPIAGQHKWGKKGMVMGSPTQHSDPIAAGLSYEEEGIVMGFPAQPSDRIAAVLSYGEEGAVMGSPHSPLIPLQLFCHMEKRGW